MSTYEMKLLNKFIGMRNKLIDELDCGKIDKKKFLFENYMLLTRLNIKPFAQANTIEKCVYNYQYYNILAKYAKAFPMKKSQKGSFNEVNHYYNEKDKTILSLLQNKNVGRVLAYPIKLNSLSLNNRLIEIILLDHEKLILHSKSEEIKKMLIDNNSYENKPRLSVINSYVNNSY